ncbi:hypothetical protein IQ235_09500 [Oscillatoriales cyanobacterium LEGE 11467]|uniref:Uncharacterized protein n=1 Tax=Zarconia navalis LEGE 11467 TaxID=1828826 RepID=A0A928VVC4_9CYAN|nr:hypothetical protein [Zarconia navalis]MBE9041014.1 hypothetical protein [Zarconia navalis LEGE 11467]
MSQNLRKETWWLSYATFPDLIWALLQVYDNDVAEVLTMDGDRYRFENEEEARLWLSEDEYSSFTSLDEDDEEDLGCSISSIQIPSGNSDNELVSKMYVKRRHL